MHSNGRGGHPSSEDDELVAFADDELEDFEEDELEVFGADELEVFGADELEVFGDDELEVLLLKYPRLANSLSISEAILEIMAASTAEFVTVFSTYDSSMFHVSV